MKYVMVIHETPASFGARGQGPQHPYTAAWRAYYKALVESGAYLGGAPLKEPGTATTVRIEQGRRRVQDGPFAEAKEQLAGFFILEAPTLDAALDWASRCPAAAAGAVEVRLMDTETHETITKE